MTQKTDTVSWDSLPFDIQYEIVRVCDKSALLSLRLVSRDLSELLLKHIYNQLVLEIQNGTSLHLHRAVITYHESAMASLLKAGAPINQRNKQGETALHIAARSNYMQAAQLLLEAGADVDTTSHHEWTPLLLASRYGNVEMIRLLVDAGADVNRQGFRGWTGLHYAVREGYVDAAKMLLEYGARIEVRDAEGRTVLENEKYRRSVCVEMLRCEA